MIEFHVLTPRGSVHLISAEGGRIVLDSPHAREPFAPRGSNAGPIASARAKFQNDAPHDLEVDASVI